MSQLFNHARLILADRVIERGALETVNGVITAIHEQPLPEGCGMDLGGDDLIPGLVEVHTDNLEKHLMPRNGVLWPMLPAVITHDAQCVAAGITTVLLLALEQFEQVFDQPAHSSANIRLRATLMGYQAAGEVLLGQQLFTATLPAPSANAAGGAAALSQATDAVGQQLTQWLQTTATAR